MFKKLATKLMLGYLTVIIIALFLLGVMLNLLFQKYYEIEKERRLTVEGQTVSKIVTDYFENKITLNNMNKLLEETEHHLNAEIVLFNLNGDIYDELRPFEHLKECDPFTDYEWDKVVSGEILAKKSIGFNNHDDMVLSVAVPVYSYQEVVGAISLHSTIYDIENSMKQIQKLIIFAGLLSLIVSIILTYFLSQRITRPLSEINNAALKLASGKYTSLLSVKGEDEIAQLAGSFNTMANELAKIEQVRRDFIANVSHELRSPVTFIRGVLQGIVDEKLGDRASQELYAKAALNRTKGMSRIIQDLIDLSLIESKTFRLELVKVDLNELIRRVLLQLEPQFEEKAISLELKLFSEAIWIMADADRIGQVLINLFDNALKYTAKYGNVKVKSIVNNDTVLVEISDSGVGISPEELSLIWERFYKVEKVRTPDSDNLSTGLGLAIVKQLIQIHGGQIDVASKVNKGTTFTIKLPITSVSYRIN